MISPLSGTSVVMTLTSCAKPNMKSQIVPIIARLYEKTAKILATVTIILTNIKTNFFKQMDKGIRCFLLSNDCIPSRSNRTVVMRLICGLTICQNDALVTTLGGYRLCANEYSVPPVSPDDASLLKKYVWGEQAFFCLNANFCKQGPINEVWVKKNTYEAQLGRIRYRKEVSSYNKNVTSQQHKIKDQGLECFTQYFVTAT